jgi:Spy/CpxP family protein refolding chaperone
MGPGGPGIALGALDLSDAQREQVRQIRDRYREQNQAAQTRLGDLRGKQRAAIERLPVDETLITSATQDLVQAQVEVALQEARLNAEIWAVLTAEQQAQVTKARAERASRMAEREARASERRQQMQQRRNRQ